MIGSCHCGRVTVRLPGPPDYLNPCNCSLCMKLGAAWGYYPPDGVAIEGETRAYERADVERPHLTLHFCGACGATVNWSPAAHLPQDRLGINMRLFEPGELAGIEVRYGDRRADGDVEPRPYLRPPAVFDGKGAIP